MKLTELTLFQDPTCPFCQRVLHFMRQKGMSLPMRDTLQDLEAYKELFRGGGRGMVPCLKIDHGDDNVEWLYESLDIMKYLDQNVSSSRKSG